MKRKFFMKRLRHFLVVMIIPMLVLVVFFMVSSVKQTLDKLKAESEQTISNINSNLGIVLAGVEEQCETIASNVRMSMALKRTLLGESVLYNDILYLDSLQLTLYGAVNAYDYLESAYIGMAGAERVISSEYGFMTIDALEDQEWLEICEQMETDEKSCIVCRTCREGKVDEHQVLTVCSRMVLGKGFVVFNVNVDKLQAMMEELKINSGAWVYLTDKDGRILACSKGSGDQERQKIQKQLQERSYTEGWQIAGGTPRLVSYAQEEATGCYVVSIASLREFTDCILEEVKKLTLFLLLTVCVVVLIAYYVTSQSFRHIEEILDMFEKAEKGIKVEPQSGAPKDEYDVILSNIVSVFINNSYLELQLKERQVKQENAELMALQLQINPHFLYNTLQTLQMEMQKAEGGAKCSRITGAVSDILKYALGPADCPVSLREELEYLKKYTEVQQYRFGEFMVFYELDDDIQGAEVFRLMLQPILENSLLHGLRNILHRGVVKLCIRRKEGMLQFRVIDNGEGMTREELLQLRRKLEENEGSSIGLINLNRRLQLRYGTQCRLVILSKKSFGTSVTFTIPYREL